MQQTKHVNCEFLKAISEAGTFEGWLARYDNVDAGGDQILQGAFQKNLVEKGDTRPLLWQHDSTNPIGTLVLEDKPQGLWAKGQLLMSLPEAQRAFQLMKAGIVRGLSIGYKVVRDEMQGNVRRLKELVLWEGSAVTLPMNELARITSIKTLDTTNIELALKSFRDDILNELKGNQ